jgi:hypothetical protein
VTAAGASIKFTRLGQKMVRALAALNDQYSFFLFLEYQFREQLQNLGKYRTEQYTSEAFPDNPFGPRIHVRVDRLGAFLDANRGVSFGAYLSTSYEVAASFPERTFELLKKTNASTVRFPPKRPEGPEQYYRRVIAASGYALPQQEILDTLSFIRYRRNAIVHLSSVPNAAYLKFVRSSGPILASYWKRSKVQINFSTATIGPPSERDTLDLLKLLRICSQNLDAHLASIIHIPGLISLEAYELFGTEHVRMNLFVREKRENKLLALLKLDFGFTGAASMLGKTVASIGVK